MEIITTSSIEDFFYFRTPLAFITFALKPKHFISFTLCSKTARQGPILSFLTSCGRCGIVACRARLFLLLTGHTSN